MTNVINLKALKRARQLMIMRQVLALATGIVAGVIVVAGGSWLLFALGLPIVEILFEIGVGIAVGMASVEFGGWLAKQIRWQPIGTLAIFAAEKNTTDHLKDF
jgi:hypothetical protein